MTPTLPTDIAETVAANTALKVLIIDAICGVGFPSYLLATECEKAGMAVWEAKGQTYHWDRNALVRSPLSKLQALYQALCEARDEARAPVANAAPQWVLHG